MFRQRFPRWWRHRLLTHPKLRSWVRRARAWLPPANFITLHYAYFILACLATSLIFWVSSSSGFNVSYVDSLYLVISAMSESGLNPVNLSQITTWQQVLLWLLMVLGSTIWVSVLTVLARKHAFERRFDTIVKAERERALKRRETLKALPMMERILSIRKVQSNKDQLQSLGTPIVPKLNQGDSPDSDPPPRPISYPAGSHSDHSTSAERDDPRQSDTPDAAETSAAGTCVNGHIAFAPKTRPNAVSSSSHQSNNHPPRRTVQTSSVIETEGDGEHEFHWRHILRKRNVGRNAQFHGLSSEERERLGGYEYRSLKMLAVVVPLYGFLWQFLGAVALGAWIANNSPQTATSNGVGAWWSGIFYAVSAFNNNGMSLIDLNMIPFQQAYFILITMSLLILAGNTAYPLFLRLIFWLIWKVLKLATSDTAFCDTKSTLEFVLNYPRRVYTNLFPSRPTWWLLFMLVLLNSIDWLLFEVLNIGNPIIEAIPVGPRIMDGLFQAIGMSVIPAISLSIETLTRICQLCEVVAFM